MENNNIRLTPEELLEQITGYVSSSVISIPKNWIYQVMLQYAAQEIENKDAQLREANRLLKSALNRTQSMLRNVDDGQGVYDWMRILVSDIKDFQERQSTGKEAGNDEI